jgi:hypothetical protein
MTTDFARKPADPSAHSPGGQASGAQAVQIPVLIRLPDLTEILAAAQRRAAPHPGTPPVTPSPDTARVPSKPQSAVGAQIPNSPEAPSATPAPGMVDRTRSFADSHWLDFRLPASVVRGAVAASLIAVFVVAYLLIVGGGDTSQELAGGDGVAPGEPAAATAGDDQPVDQPVQIDGSAASQAAPSSTALPPADDPQGEVPARQEMVKRALLKQAIAKQAAAESQKPSSDTAVATGAAQPPAQYDEAQIQPLTAGPGRAEQSGFAADPAPTNIQQTEFASPAASEQPLAEQAEREPAADERSGAAEDSRPAGFSNEVPGEVASETNEPAGGTPVGGFYPGPPVDQSAGRAAETLSNSAPYPVTNPASFQYPANYHELLQGTLVPRANHYAPWSDGANGQAQPPSTARLQPRIDPPPLR